MIGTNNIALQVVLFCVLIIHITLFTCHYYALYHTFEIVLISCQSVIGFVHFIGTVTIFTTILNTI